MKYIFQTKNLTKSYHNEMVLNNININVPEGSIYGLIGENGAGKTTIFRIISGLSFQDSGNFSLLGKESTNEIREARKQIGCTIESPAIYSNFTIIDNLKVQQMQKGLNNSEKISDVIKLVGLEQQRKKKARNLSFGMKQRLSLALALINDPKLLILDEPVNGLDPTGIVELRNLILDLNHKNHITIIISSHILSELEHLVSHYGIISKGKMIEEITAEQLKKKCKKYIKIIVDDVTKAIEVLKNKLNIVNFEISGDTIKIYDLIEDLTQISLLLSQNKIAIFELSFASNKLEDYFSQLITGGK